eukprot:Gb_14288 [translate_table: standard]
MGISKLRQKVKEQQKRMGQKLHTVAKTAGMHHSEWVENADRLVAGFLEKFEEGCHLMSKKRYPAQFFPCLHFLLLCIVAPLIVILGSGNLNCLVTSYYHTLGQLPTVNVASLIRSHSHLHIAKEVNAVSFVSKVCGDHPMQTNCQVCPADLLQGETPTPDVVIDPYSFILLPIMFLLEL